MTKKLNLALAAMMVACAPEAGAEAGGGAAAVVEPAKIKFCDKSHEGTVVTFAFGDGEALTLDTNELSQEIILELAIHGIKQKGGDSFAGAAGDYKFAKEACKRVLDALRAGEFNAGRAAGTGSGTAKNGELAEALAAIQGIELADATQMIDALDEEVRKQVRAHPQIKAKIAEQRAAKAAASAAKAMADGKAFDLASLKAA